ncbi:MAG: DNA (cytosine-5-)-methyltransferase [Saprospiraceae bacterium]
MNLTMAELFAGIAGWSEAAKMAGGITPVWCSEIDKKKNEIVKLRHPKLVNYGDIKTIRNPPNTDILTVSFPCTGISVAGKGEGLEDKNSGLWFEAERIISKGRFRYIVIENGPALTVRGLNRILGFFASIGYDAEWTHLSGFQFGVQQRRKRLYFIAYTNKGRQQSKCNEKTIFRKLETGIRLHPMPIYPGWRERRDIPEPRTYGSAYDIPGGVHRLVCTGDAIIPLIGCYILECIKIHAHNDNR